MEQRNLELLCSLMNCHPASHDLPAVNSAVQVLQEFLQKYGVLCTVEMVGERRVLYASTMPGKVQRLLFNCHLDVVPAEEEGYEPQQRGQRLYGRGAKDDLGNLVSVVEILCRYVNKASIGAIFSTDEEIGGKTTAVMVERGYGGTEMAIVMDGPCRRTATAQKGILNVKLTATGKGGHASVPWECDNPIDKLLDGYARLRQSWKKVTGADPWQNSMAPTILTAGSANNQIPDKAEMVLNIRYIAPEDRMAILENIRRITGLSVTELFFCEPVVSDESVPAVQKFDQILRKYYPEIPAGFVRMNGATDARHLHALNIPIVMSSVEGGECHGKDEWVDLESIGIYVKILEEVIAEMGVDRV